jgi:hypothetical protein
VRDRAASSAFCFRLAAIVLLLVAACAKPSDAPRPAASQKPAAVVAPSGLIAELVVPDPRKLWSALKKLGGSRAEFLPSNFELALFSVLDLPPRVAGYVRPDTSVVGVVLAPAAGAPPVLVLAVRTVRGSELVDELTRGDGAALRAERDGSPVTVLVGAKPNPVLGVVDDWLLVGSDTAALRSAGVYLGRGLGARRLSEEPLTIDVNRAALRGPLAASVRERWRVLRQSLSAEDHKARAEKGRAPDFGDPAAVLGIADGAVGALLELIGSSERLRFVLRPAEQHLELSFSVVPEEKGELASSLEALEVGPLDPLLDLPQGVVLAALSRSSDEERSVAAERPADALRAVLGPRLAEKDAAPLADALRSFHRGRGAVAVGGILGDKSLFVEQEARDPKELERGLRGLLRLLGVPALAEPLEPIVGKLRPRESDVRVAGVEGTVHRVELVKPSQESPGLEVLLHVRGTRASAVAASKASAALTTLATERHETLGKSPRLEKLAEGRVPAAFAVYADLSPMTPGTGPAPALAVLGKKGREALLEVELTAPAGAALLERLGSP